MKLGIIGMGNVGCAIALAAVTRGTAREIVCVNRTAKTAEAVATDIRYGTPLCTKVDIRHGDYDAGRRWRGAYRQRENGRRHGSQRSARAAKSARAAIYRDVLRQSLQPSTALASILGRQSTYS